MPQSLQIHEPVLINLFGHLAGVLIFGAFALLLVRDRAASRLPGRGLSVAAALLALTWNLASLVGAGLGAAESLASRLLVTLAFACVSLLPALLLHIALGRRLRPMIWLGYGLGAAATLIHTSELVAPAPHHHPLRDPRARRSSAQVAYHTAARGIRARQAATTTRQFPAIGAVISRDPRGAAALSTARRFGRSRGRRADRYRHRPRKSGLRSGISPGWAVRPAQPGPDGSLGTASRPADEPPPRSPCALCPPKPLPSRVREGPRAYRPRHPERTALYRLFEWHFDAYVCAHEERFEPRDGPLRGVVKESVEAYLECGRLLGGFARISCPRCRGEHVPAFACRTRNFCPSCQAKRAALFAEHLGELRAPVAHRHYVFTIPKALRALFPRGGAFVPVESDARARGPDGRLLVRAGESEVAFSPLELIHALAQQIPDKGQHLVRYDGAYSNRARRLYRAAEGEGEGGGGPPPAALGDKDSDFARSRRRSWARLLRKLLEVDPLLCPRCGVEMKIVAVITDPKVIDCILAHVEAGGGNDPFDARAPPEG